MNIERFVLGFIFGSILGVTFWFVVVPSLRVFGAMLSGWIEKKLYDWGLK